MKRILLIVFFVCLGTSSKATTYYSVANGNWTGAIWSSVCSTCAGSTLPALVNGDILVIDDQVTISSGTVTVTASITIKLTTDFSPNTSTNPAKLIFVSGGKLALAAGSSVTLYNLTGNSANDPILDGTGSGGSNQITVGGTEYWRASDGDRQGVGTLQPDGTLPIKLLFFQGRLVDDWIELNWATSMEQNFLQFQILRSSDGLNFSAIGIKSGAGLDTKERQNYSFIDNSPLAGKNYYRLKSIDNDGSYEYSFVIVVDGDSYRNIAVFPNPIEDQEVYIRTNFEPQVGDKIVIIDNLGLVRVEYSPSSIESRIPLSIGKGTYLIRYITNGEVYTIRIVVSY